METESAWMRGHSGVYLTLTFAISWGFELAIALTIGHQGFLELGLAPWSMFVPASMALVLQLFVVHDSPLHIRHWDATTLIPLSFLSVTVLYGIVTLLAIVLPEQRTALGGAGNLLTTLWTLSLFALHGRVGREGFRRAGVPLGDIGKGFAIALGVVAFLLVQCGLNLALGLGMAQNFQGQLYGITLPRGLYPIALVMALVLAATGTPLAGLAATFGEEYGWRGVLFDAWCTGGKRRAALLVGLVWGIWHVPVILADIHTYPPTVPGLLLALAFFGLWGMVQAYVVLKTDSVWVASFVHGLVNSVYGFGITYLVRAADPWRSFGLGLYGVLCLALIVLLMMRDPVWQTQAESDLTGWKDKASSSDV